MTKGLEDFSLFVKRWLPAVVWMAVILAASTDWGAGSNSYLLLKPLLKWFNPAIPETEIYHWNMVFRKTMHVIQFAVLSWLIWKTRRPISYRHGGFDLRLGSFTLAVALFFSLASEGIQLLFPESRGATIKDVFLDMGGAVLGLIIIWFLTQMGLLMGKSGVRGKTLRPSHTGTRVLIAADLHLDMATGEVSVLDHLRAAIIEKEPDVCVIAGDIGNAERADHWLKLLRAATGELPLVACLGNHDHWIDPEFWDRYPNPAAVRDLIWRPAFESNNIHGLDYGNVTFGNLEITGGYGHYDLGMRDPALEVDGLRASLDDYRAGQYAGKIWSDMRNMPHVGNSIDIEAGLQAEGIGRRLSDAAASGRTILVVTHTVPFAELNQHAMEDNEDGASRFYHAYAGNTLVGKRLLEHQDRIALAVCGHTHKPVPRRIIQGIPCENVGSDYGCPRFVIFDAPRVSKR